MRALLSLCSVLVFCIPTSAQKKQKEVARPERFEIGVHTFFDFGPPFDFYELYVVRPAKSGTLVERLIFTPAANKCYAPAKLETSSASLHESINELLGSRNPCAIPDKELKRELKRCKKCLVFSGSNVRMQASCGGTSRLIRSDILDRDMFDSAANTPTNTAWTMQLLEKLNRALGPGVMEKPMFATPEDASKDATVASTDAEVLRDLARGDYDPLFPASEIRLAALYQETAKPSPPRPTAKLKTPLSVTPEVLFEPIFPPLARMTRTEGDVSVEFEVGPDGIPKGGTVTAGHPLLRAAALDAVGKWRFPTTAAGQQLKATLEFALNCHE